MALYFTSIKSLCLGAEALFLCAAAVAETPVRCELPPNISVHLPPELRFTLTESNRLCTATGRRLVVVSAPEKAFLRIGISADGTPKHPQGYLLEVAENGISVRARTREGGFNGMMALNDLLRLAADSALPRRRIAATPLFEERAVCFSVAGRSGARQGVDRIKKRLRELAALRCNLALIEFGDNFPSAENSQDNRSLNAAAVKNIVTFAADNFIGIVPISPGSLSCPRMPDDRERIRNQVRRQCELLKSKEYAFRIDGHELERHRRNCPNCCDAAPVALLAEHLGALARYAAEAGVRPSFILLDFPAGLAAKIPAMLPAGASVFGLKTPELTPDAASAGDVETLLREIRASHRRGAKRFILLVKPHVRNGDLAGPLSNTTPMFLGGMVRGFFAMWSPERPDFPPDPAQYFRLVHTGKTRRQSFRTATPVAIWPQLTAELGSTGSFPSFDGRPEEVETMRKILREQPERFELAVCFGGRYYGALLAGNAAQKLPERVEIPLGGVKAGAIALLLGCSSPRPAAEFDPGRDGGKAFYFFDVAALHIQYADGQKAVRMLKYRRHLSGWDESFGGYDRRTAFAGRDARGRSFRFDAVTIDNPEPDKPIVKLILQSLRDFDTAPALLAVSLLDMKEGKLPEPDLRDELLRINFRPPPRTAE